MTPPIPILRARDLRERATKAERLLWRHIRDRQLSGVKFRRQQRIGRFIVDFFAPEKRLIVELDGGQHALLREMERDAHRTRDLEEMGFHVCRFWNREVLQNLEGVLKVIEKVMAGQSDERRVDMDRPPASPRGSSQTG